MLFIALFFILGSLMGSSRFHSDLDRDWLVFAHYGAAGRTKGLL